jgi:putative transposase
MTATLDGVANKRKDKPEPTTEQQVAEERVRRAREQGVSLTGPDGLLMAAGNGTWLGSAGRPGT